MEWLQPAGTDPARAVQARLDLPDPGRLALLRQSPAMVDLGPDVPEPERHLLRQSQCLAGGLCHPVRPAQPDVDQRDPVAEGEAGRVGVVQLAHPTEIELHRLRRLVGEAQVPEVPCLVVHGCGARIVAEAMAQIAMRRRVVALERLPRERQRLREAARVKALQGRACAARRGGPAVRVAFPPARRSVGELGRARGGDVVAGPLPEHGRQLQATRHRSRRPAPWRARMRCSVAGAW